MNHAQKYLAQANRQIAELAVQVARQRVIVKRALDDGQGSEMAESLLDALERSLRIFEEHRIFLLSSQRIIQRPAAEWWAWKRHDKDKSYFPLIARAIFITRPTYAGCAPEAQAIFCRRRRQASRPPPAAKIRPGQASTGDGASRECRPKKFGGVQETKQVNTHLRAVVSQEDERNRSIPAVRPKGHSAKAPEWPLGWQGTSSRQVGLSVRIPPGKQNLDFAHVREHDPDLLARGLDFDG
jgi:hypothetical protein